jgi:CO/xanthine dehydrogenase FAD-binding subunit
VPGSYDEVAAGAGRAESSAQATLLGWEWRPMSALEYCAPNSLSELVAALGAASAEPVHALAGGTDLLVQMRTGTRKPGRIVDLKRVPELTRITISDETLKVGAAVPAAEIVEHPELARLVPGLVEATDLIGSTQIQGRATLGGNLCNGSPAADTVPALEALEARCLVVGPEGERELAVSEVVTGPGQTSLAVGEAIVEFRIARPVARSADAYLRLIPRSEMDIAVVGAAASLRLDEAGRCTHARIVLGAVGPTTIEVPDAAAALVGTEIDEAALAGVAAAASAAARPIDDKRGTTEYRKHVAGVLARRSAAIAADRARNWSPR